MLKRLYTAYSCPQCGAPARDSQSVPGSWVCSSCGLRFVVGAERLPRRPLARLRAWWHLLGDAKWVLVFIAIAALLVLAPPYLRHFSWRWLTGG